MDNIELHWLDPDDSDQAFPHPERALKEPNGLLAVGGDLSPSRLLKAYDQGIFPWYNPDEPILWWSPNPRAVFLPESVHVSRSLRRCMRRANYAVTLDADFDGVLDGCAAPRKQQRGTWLGANMRRAYRRLHHLGHAHSVEIWRRGRLIGGIYGVARGRAFFGESMFSAETDASKLALVWLSQQLQQWQFLVMDAQVGSPHLYRMGAMDLSRPRFQSLLREAVDKTAPRQLPPSPKWSFNITVPSAPDHTPNTGADSAELS